MFLVSLIIKWTMASNNRNIVSTEKIWFKNSFILSWWTAIVVSKCMEKDTAPKIMSKESVLMKVFKDIFNFNVFCKLHDTKYMTQWIYMEHNRKPNRLIKSHKCLKVNRILRIWL